MAKDKFFKNHKEADTKTLLKQYLEEKEAADQQKDQPCLDSTQINPSSLAHSLTGR